MQLNWLYTTLLSIIWFAAQTSAQYTTSPVYTPPPTSYGPPDYGTSCIPSTTTVTSVISTIVTSVTTTTDFVTRYTQAPYGYDNSYIPPMKKHTGLIIGLVVGLCGLALIFLVAFLLLRRKKKVEGYGKDTGTYGKDTTTPATTY